MTWPMTLAALPRAGAISKPHDYKENVQKMKDLQKMTFTENLSRDFRPKNQKIQSSNGESNKRTTRHQWQKLNMKHVDRKKLTEAKLKKAFRIKLLELCKTRTKKSSPELFNFYVISASHDIAKDTSSTTTCRRNFKAPWLQTERTKKDRPSEIMSFYGEKFENFRKKVQKVHS